MLVASVMCILVWRSGAARFHGNIAQIELCVFWHVVKTIIYARVIKLKLHATCQILEGYKCWRVFINPSRNWHQFANPQKDIGVGESRVCVVLPRIELRTSSLRLRSWRANHYTFALAFSSTMLLNIIQQRLCGCTLRSMMLGESSFPNVIF